MVSQGAPCTRSAGALLIAVFLALSLGLGILWEIAESLFFNLGRRDTLVDLVVDTAGAALAGTFVGWLLREQGLGPART